MADKSDPDTALRVYVERLYTEAGMPPTRRMADDLAAGGMTRPPSHATVHRVITWGGRTRLAYLQAIVGYLGGDVDRATKMWQAAAKSRRISTAPLTRNATLERIADSVDRIADAVELLAEAVAGGKKKT